jgi:ATPase subunit of ABC transporter with duplicated ATPase domains
LLLDEPTNNLDLNGITLLEQFLTSTNSGVLIVSHDRRLLENATNTILWLDTETGTVRSYATSFAAFEAAREKERLTRNRHYREYEEQRATLRALVTQTTTATQNSRARASDNDKLGRNARGERAASKAAKARRSIVRQLETLEEPPRPDDSETVRMAFSSVTMHGARFLSLEHLIVTRGQFTLGPVSLAINAGERIALIGYNGSGKTTLARVIVGEITDFVGERWIRPHLRIAYLDQHHTNLAEQVSPVETLRAAGLDPETSMHSLIKMGFSRDEAVHHKMGLLSPGMRARVLFALISGLQAELLVLDEPTNHIDFAVTDALEEGLRAYEGTILVVSHDRKFLEQIGVDRLIQLSDGNIDDDRILGGISD